MLTNALVAHGVALDTARLKGETICLWRLRHDYSKIDTGLACGPEGLKEVPEGAVIYARYTPLEAVKHMLRMSMVITWHDIAFCAATKEAALSGKSQAVWELEEAIWGKKGYFTCHTSIEIPNATRMEVILVA